MKCLTCDHTMESLGASDYEGFFQCPRCGTVIVHPYLPEYGAIKVHTPKLVERCRAFEKKNVEGAIGDGGQDAPWINTDWTALGIAESINLPQNRPA